MFAEPFKRTIGDLLTRPVIEKGDSKWDDALPRITKQQRNRTHSSTKLTPIEGSLKRNEAYIYQIFLDKRKKIKVKIKIHDPIRTAELRKTFSNWDTNNWSYIFYKNTEIIIDTVPSFCIDN